MPSKKDFSTPEGLRSEEDYVTAGQAGDRVVAREDIAVDTVSLASDEHLSPGQSYRSRDGKTHSG